MNFLTELPPGPALAVFAFRASPIWLALKQKHRCGLQIPAQAKQFACFAPDYKLRKKPPCGGFLLKWSGRLDLNQRPHGPEPCALPSALRPVNVRLIGANQCFKWSGRRESNPRSLAPQASALPLSHSPKSASALAGTSIFYHSFSKSSSVSLISVRNFTSVRARLVPPAAGK